MPILYVALHVTLAALGFTLALRLAGPVWLRRLLGALCLGLVVTGLVVERRQDWAWAAMWLARPDAVYLTNLSLGGVAVLLGAVWRQAQDRRARLRALLLTPFALAAALWSYAWYFAPLPPGLAGTINAEGFCFQTSDTSCSAAAAVTLLHRYGINTTEGEMGRLCLTRAGYGTPPLGLYRGLALKAPTGMHPRLETAGRWDRMPAPCIISVGVSPRAPAAVVTRLRGFGWQPGVYHAVVVLDVDVSRRRIDVADPSYGREAWPVDGLEHLWDGRALALRAGERH